MLDTWGFPRAGLAEAQCMREQSVLGVWVFQ